MSGLDELEQAAEARRRRPGAGKGRETRQPPKPRNPRPQSSTASPPVDLAGLDLSKLDLSKVTPAQLDTLIPRPTARSSSGEELSTDERSVMDRCESILRLTNLAFWARGRVLDTIRQGDLHIERHPTFEDYVLQVWQMSISRAYQLMDGWKLAELIANKPLKDGSPALVNEGQIRTLVPFARKHGDASAAEVYALTAQYAPSVTAKTLSAAIKALPREGFDRQQAEVLIQECFAEKAIVVAATDTPAVEAVEAKVQSVVARLSKLAHDPASANRIADSLEEAARKLRADFSE